MGGTQHHVLRLNQRVWAASRAPLGRSCASVMLRAVLIRGAHRESSDLTHCAETCWWGVLAPDHEAPCACSWSLCHQITAMPSCRAMRGQVCLGLRPQAQARRRPGPLQRRRWTCRWAWTGGSSCGRTSCRSSRARKPGRSCCSACCRASWPGSCPRWRRRSCRRAEGSCRVLSRVCDPKKHLLRCSQ